MSAQPATFQMPPASRALSTMRELAKRIPRQQATPNMPRVAAKGTMLRLETGIPAIHQRPTVHTILQQLSAQFTLADFFGGAGGSAMGAIWANMGHITSYNHWPEAVANHAMNIPGTHFVADLSLAGDLAGAGVHVGPGQFYSTGDHEPGHSELFGPADVVWNSAPCPPWSPARTKGKDSKSDTRSPQEKLDALKKARGSMFSALDYAFVHRPKAVITENVEELLRWEGMRGWLALWEDYGYVTVPVHLNSAFVGAFDERAPQWRDRVYFAHILKQYAKNLDLSYTPEADCAYCGKSVAAVQTWKNGKTAGKYRTQYIYTCPRCTNQVHPPTRGMEVAMDLSNLGTPIAERSLGITTLTRIENGLAEMVEKGLAPQPLIVTQDRSNQPEIKPARPWSMTGATLTGRQVLGFVTHPDLMPGASKVLTRAPRAIDCNFRQVQPQELSNVAGFPDTWLWYGSKRDNSLATGNAVTPRVSQFFFERTVAALTA